MDCTWGCQKAFTKAFCNSGLAAVFILNPDPLKTYVRAA